MAIKTTYTIKLLPSAKRDLFEITAKIATDKPQTALKYMEKLRLKLSMLSFHPYMGRLSEDSYLKSKRYRVLVLDNYLAFYILTKRTVKIRRILHGSRDMASVVFDK